MDTSKGTFLYGLGCGWHVFSMFCRLLSQKLWLAPYYQRDFWNGAKGWYSGRGEMENLLIFRCDRVFYQIK